MNRLAVTGAVAVVLASLSLSSVIATADWIAAGAGAVAVVAITGALTRLPTAPAAVTATVLVLVALVPLLTRPGWASRSAALLILVITALSATGARLLRRFGVLVSYLAAVLLYLNLTFAHAASFGYLIPSDSSISALARLWQQAFAEFRYAPPVPDLAAVSFVTAAGIGAVAIAVDILAVRLRRPAVAGLPLLLLFSVPVASNLKAFGLSQMLIFAVSMAGYLALLSADGRARLRMWGRLVTFRHVQSAGEAGSGPDTRELSASGRRIGLAAVCLGIVIPVILPSPHTRDVFARIADGSGHGGGSAGVSPLLTVQNLLKGKPRKVLSYTTTAKNPGEHYLQAYALNYNARQNAWLPSLYSDDRGLDGPKLPWQAPGVERTTPTRPVKTTITISSHYTSTGPAVLPMPYAPDRLYISGPGWLEAGSSLTVFNPAANMAGLQYTVDSEEADPQASQISGFQPSQQIVNEYGTYNGPHHAQVYNIALKHIGLATTELQEAQNLENWFLSGTFKYSLKPGLPAGNWLIPFLTTDHRGYCSQFAQAFADLARSLGIPVRIAVGYTGGTHVSGNAWEVTTADAHAWPEVYFAGQGWLRFEPTPSGSVGQGTAEVPPYAAAGGPAGSSGQGSSTSQGGSSGAGSSSAQGSKRHLPPGASAQVPGGGHAPAAAKAGSSALALAVGIPAGLFLLIAWPALTRLLTRRRRWLAASGDAGVARTAWRELTDYLADYGLGCAPGETPRAVARRVTGQARLPATASKAISRLATAQERAQYARLPEPAAGLKTALLTVRRAVAASVPRGQRLRARLLPASTLLAARQLLQRASEMLSWLDAPSWPALRRQLRRPARPG